MAMREPEATLRLVLEDRGQPHELQGRCPACRARITVRVQPNLRGAQAKIRRYRFLDLESEVGTVDLDLEEGPKSFYCLCGRILSVGLEAVIVEPSKKI